MTEQRLGPGNTCVSGTIDTFDVDVHGSGSLDGYKLLATDAEVVVEGPGKAIIGNARHDRKGTRRTD